MRDNNLSVTEKAIVWVGIVSEFWQKMAEI